MRGWGSRGLASGDEDGKDGYAVAAPAFEAMYERQNEAVDDRKYEREIRVREQLFSIFKLSTRPGFRLEFSPDNMWL